jgi:3-dehydroquinate synthase
MLPDHILLSSQPGPDLQRFLVQKNYSQLLVLTDENTHRLCWPHVQAHLPPHQLLQVRSGEQHKNLDTCTQVWDAMTDHQMDRHSALIVVGGGVLGDLGGFCAATYKRGVDFILVPTTLLAQADASIGGKTGIDFHLYKNHIGVFHQPALTLLWDGFLETLPIHELRSGFAEVIKHVLLSDRALWDDIRQRPLEKQDWKMLLRHSAEFKYSIVEKDPTEKGMRKLLNAGHTIGHAIETHFLATNRAIMHGEAVAAGLVLEAFLAMERSMLSREDLDALAGYILNIFGKLKLDAADADAVVAISRQDKKNKGNKILAVLPEGIGKARWDCEITEEDIVRSMAYYRSLDVQRV